MRHIGLRRRHCFRHHYSVLVLHFSQQTSNKAKTSAVLGSDGPFPSASTAHMYTIRQASTWHWYYNLSLNTRLRLLLNDHAKTEPCASFKSKLYFSLSQFPSSKVASEQRSSNNGDHEHSAHFITRDYEAFACRIIWQKVQRVPAQPKVGWQGRQSTTVHFFLNKS